MNFLQKIISRAALQLSLKALSKSSAKRITRGLGKGSDLMYYFATYSTARRTEINAEKYTNAIEAAYDRVRPRRGLYLQMAQQVGSDPQVVSSMRTRRKKFKAKRFAIYSERTKLIDRKKTAWLQSTWFARVQEYFVDTDFYQHSLLQFFSKKDNKSVVKRVKLIPREFLVPEHKMILRSEYDEQGINYEENPEVLEYLNLLEIERGSGIGLFESIIPEVIRKRDADGDLADMSEIQGQDLLVLKSDNEKNKKKFLAMGSSAGANRLYTIDPDEELTNIKSNTGVEHKGYLERMKYSDESNAKIIVGNTMTSNKGAGGKSQGEVHERTENNYTGDDAQDFKYWVEEELMPFLAKQFGYKFSKSDRFKFISEEEDEQGKIGVKPKPSNGKPSEKKSEVTTQEATTTIATKNSPSLYFSSIYNPPRARLDFELHTKDIPEDSLLAIALEALQKVFRGKLRSGSVDKKLYELIRDTLYESIEEGYGGNLLDFDTESVDYKTIEALRDSQAVFAAHKVYHFINDINLLLVDEAGKIRDWASFKKLALEVHERYNINWLRTEYQTSVKSAQMAARWTRIIKQKDIFPFLKYSTVGDGNVRASHARLDGIILPIDHPFWKKYMPLNGYNCRCNVIAVTADMAEERGVTQDDRLKDLPALDPVFENNAGATGRVFSSKHPYYKNVSSAGKNSINKLIN